jgi:hypothetical protein
VASRGEVDSRAAEAVQRVEQRLGTKLDPESRQQIYNDVLSIWSYTPVAEPPPKSKPPVSGKGRIHVVKPGETLSRLATIPKLATIQIASRQAPNWLFQFE